MPRNRPNQLLTDIGGQTDVKMTADIVASLSLTYDGATENVGLENAGLENAAPDCRGGKRGSSTVWKAEVSVI